MRLYLLYINHVYPHKTWKNQNKISLLISFTIMKGVILHGGNGTRLRPLTYTDVKQLLPLAGKPVSEYALLNLIELGITEVNIIVGEIGEKEVRDYYGNGSKWGISITYTYQEKPLGIAHAIGLTRDFVGKDSFVVVLGDNFFQNGLTDLYEAFKKGKFDSLIALTTVENPRQFGIAEISGNRIISLVEKPNEPRSNLAITGAYFLTYKIFSIIDILKPSWRNELEITEAFQIMLEKGMSIGYTIISGWWKDTGTVDEFLDCNRMVLDKSVMNSPKTHRKNISGRVYLGQNVVLDPETRILGPCYIGNGTTLEKSYIGPYTSIGSNCLIRDSEIEDSVIMDSCKIELGPGNRIRESLIGANVVIEPVARNGNSRKLVVGRDSKLVL